MARLITVGFETGDVASTSTPATPDKQCNVGSIGSSNSDTSFVRSGDRSLRLDGAAGGTRNWQSLSSDITGALDRSYFFRFYFAVSALPSGTVRIGRISNSVDVRLTAAGKLQLFDGTSQVGSDSAVTIALNTWYRVELRGLTSNGAAIDQGELLLDGAKVAGSNALTIADVAPGQVFAGWLDSPGVNSSLWLDDIAVNDDTAGGRQTTWPGEGKIVMLSPISDSAGGTGWVLGTGTALGGNGFAALDNEPPTGVADLAAGSDPKQIRNATAAANSNMDLNLTSYSTAGLKPSDRINVLVPFVATAAPVTTASKQGTIGVASNPAIANVALNSIGTAGAFWSGVTAGTYPTGWKWNLGTTTYDPAVVLSTSPVLRITQVTSSTRIAMACAGAMYVDYTPRVPRAPAVNHQNPAVV